MCPPRGPPPPSTEWRSPRAPAPPPSRERTADPAAAGRRTSARGQLGGCAHAHTGPCCCHWAEVLGHRPGAGGGGGRRWPRGAPAQDAVSALYTEASSHPCGHFVRPVSSEAQRGLVTRAGPGRGDLQCPGLEPGRADARPAAAGPGELSETRGLSAPTPPPRVGGASGWAWARWAGQPVGGVSPQVGGAGSTRYFALTDSRTHITLHHTPVSVSLSLSHIYTPLILV